jgi:PBSX family phage terminase large subunit
MKTINLSKWQTLVRKDNHRYKVINCGRRAGKSYLVSVQMLQFATDNDKSISWYISPNYKQSKSIMWAMLRELIPQEIIASKNETELKFVLTNGSEILLKGAEDPDSLRGVRIDFAVFDETAFIDKWEEVWKVVRPTLVDSKASVWFISTPNGFNHFKTLYEAEAVDSSYKSFHFTSYDNPYLDKEELDKAKQEMDDDSFQQEFMGEFRKMSGLIYKEFNRDTHMVDIPPLDYNYTFTRSLDFGFAHKTAVGYFAVSGKEIYMYDGFYKEGMTEVDIAEVIKTKDAGRIITNPLADSAQPMSIEELKRHGVHFNPVEKGPDSVKNGIVKVAELLKIRADTGRPTLMFNKNLGWIADEFESYRWMENRSVDNSIKEVPLKINDDAMDMIRYFAMGFKQRQTVFKVNDFSAWKL